MTPSATVPAALQCANPGKHKPIASSLGRVLQDLGFGDVEVLQNNLVTTEAFLGPWTTYRDDYVLNPKFNGEGLKKGNDKLVPLFEHVKRAVSGRSRRSSRLGEDAGGLAHTVHLYTSLIDSLMAPGGHYDSGSKSDEGWLRQTCAELYALVMHLKAEYAHGHGELFDAIEARVPCSWLKKAEADQEDEEDPNAAEAELEEEEDEEYSFEPSRFDYGEEVEEADANEAEADEDEEMEGDINYYTSVPPLTTPHTRVKTAGFDGLLPRGSRAPRTFAMDLVASARRNMARNAYTTHGEDEEVGTHSTTAGAREIWVIPDTTPSKYEKQPEYAALRKMFSGDIRPKLPAGEHKNTVETVKKVAKSAAPSPPQTVTPALAPVVVKDVPSDLGPTQEQLEEEEEKQELLLMYKMFGHNPNKPLPAQEPIVIDDDDDDNDTDSPLSSPPHSQASIPLSPGNLSGLLSPLSLSKSLPQTPSRRKANLPLFRQLSTSRPTPEAGMFDYDSNTPFSPLPAEDPFVE